MELLILFKSFVSFLPWSLKKYDQGQAAAWMELASDFWSETKRRSTLSCLRRQEAWIWHQILSCGKPRQCHDVVWARVRGNPLNFLLSRYQRAEASSISQCDDRCSNVSSNESRRRWKAAVGATGTAEFKSVGHTWRAHWLNDLF